MGIDPGASGGLAIIGSDRNFEAVKTPNDEKEIWYWISDGHTQGQVVACIEQVGGYIAGVWGKDGSSFSPGNAMFNFGRSYGFLRGCLVAAGIPFIDATPQRWQKELGIKRNKGESRTAWKNRLRAVAQSLYSSQEVTLATADALLIAEYCRRRFP